MKARKAVSPTVASIILIGTALLLALTVSSLSREIAFSNVKVEVIEYSYIYSTTNPGLGNARWKIVFYVFNRGTTTVELTDVFVNDKIIDEYGLIHGETLSRGDSLGTSLLMEGLQLKNGEGVELYVWIGDKMFSSRTIIVISMNPINNVILSKSVKLS